MNGTYDHENRMHSWLDYTQVHQNCLHFALQVRGVAWSMHRVTLPSKYGIKLLSHSPLSIFIKRSKSRNREGTRKAKSP